MFSELGRTVGVLERGESGLLRVGSRFDWFTGPGRAGTVQMSSQQGLMLLVGMHQ